MDKDVRVYTDRLNSYEHFSNALLLFCLFVKFDGSQQSEVPR